MITHCFYCMPYFLAYRIFICFFLQVVSQLFRARELDVSTQEKAANFNQIQESWNQSHALFMDSVEQVYNHSREIQAILMDTKVGKL